MNRAVLPLVIFAALTAFFAAGTVSCQETEEAPAQVVPPEAAQQETVPAKIPEPAKAETTTVYGEVTAVNAQAGSITVQYFDEDTEEEKALELVSDKGTKLENVASVGEIKKGDWVDAAYSVKEGKNIAASVFVEKEEEDTLTEEDKIEANSDEKLAEE